MTHRILSQKSPFVCVYSMFTRFLCFRVLFSSSKESIGHLAHDKFVCLLFSVFVYSLKKKLYLYDCLAFRRYKSRTCVSVSECIVSLLLVLVAGCVSHTSRNVVVDFAGWDFLFTVLVKAFVCLGVFVWKVWKLVELSNVVLFWFGCCQDLLKVKLVFFFMVVVNRVWRKHCRKLGFVF